ncbi:NAD(P)-dependent dehydrogenase, short-chain alcohol dehydrogenase family [Parafrankia irregularis]|uniref:NAD(P)-dependent dehydrogenase, short-chain alcohol dehydrogenase family n=1 Tax=Parafrankia irregularis TaxID=795642 RepID=A0A0S4QH39_9ACTN|nr:MULTISPECIES: SDR family NAD(P)-dependent oxidoreductase [Parafrankia]MBE3200779.1 SDR family oxidoreductase [Parafrankia sp. CH37]CUU54829.1 NAD(P)-dependent dehydrogenase, short-chain alcohol dehydrogenase family [Parafrankia irregularis]
MGLLDGKVAIITGAGHGIGRGHALELARHGAKVVVNDLGGSVRGEGQGRAADETVALIEKRGGTAVADYSDVGDHEQCGALIKRAIDAFGRLDILVNNAGIVRDAAIWNMPPEDFDAVIRVHVRGTWSTCHHAARYWRAAAKSGETVHGRIINTTSGAGLGGNFGQTSYAAAKAAIVAITQTLAMELYRSGVTVNAVGPSGLTRITASIPGMGDSFEPDAVADDEWHAMDPSNSSPLVAWLASDEADHVTGQVIRSIEDRIIWMQGWKERKVIAAGQKRWDATKLSEVINQDLFETRAPGMRF